MAEVKVTVSGKLLSVSFLTFLRLSRCDLSESDDDAFFLFLGDIR